jgi:hypothetical protein
MVFRYSSQLRYNENIKRCLLVIEDVYPIGHRPGRFTLENNDKLTHIVCKTEWHANAFKKYVDYDVAKKVIVIGNAIEPLRFKNNDNIIKKKWRFIFSSDPTRGAWNMVRLIPKIQQIIPMAEFHFYVSFESPLYQSYHKIDALKYELLKLNNVFLHPRVSQDKLAEEMMVSDIWIYPTTFQETYCITALEIQMAKVLAIYFNPSCLNETIGDRGILIPGNPNDGSSDNLILNVITDLANNKINKNDYLERGYEWAKQQTWNAIITKYIEILNYAR